MTWDPLPGDDALGHDALGRDARGRDALGRREAAGGAEPELAASFRRVPGGAVAFFEQPQASVVRSLVAQVAELVSADAETDEEIAPDPARPLNPKTPPTPEATLDNLEAELGLSSHVEAPDDPVLARLLPDAYSDNPEAAAEFRRYTEESLRSGKVESAQVVLASLPPAGGEVRLSEPECQQWLKAINDVRLALSVRLGITDEDDDLTEHLELDDPRSAYVWVYQWLAYLQDSLVAALG